MSKQTKITKSARGENCQIRIPGVCNHSPDTVVFCHVGGGGMAIKSIDAHGAYGCSSCHDYVDGRVKTEYDKNIIKLWFLEAVLRTQIILIEKGLIKI